MCRLGLDCLDLAMIVPYRSVFNILQLMYLRQLLQNAQLSSYKVLINSSSSNKPHSVMCVGAKYNYRLFTEHFIH